MSREARSLCCVAMVLLAGATPAWGQGGDEITALLFMPDGKTAIAASLDDKLHVIDVASGKVRSALEAHKDGVWAAALSPDGKTIATGGGDNMVRLWDAIKLKEIRRFEGHTKEVFAVAFSPDGKTLASGGGDRAIRTWDVATGKQLKVWHGHELKVLSVAFSPDGKTLASGGSCTAVTPGFVQGATHADQVRLWEAATGKEIRALTRLATTVSFTPDGRALVTAGHFVTATPREDGSSYISRGSKGIVGPPAKEGEFSVMKGAGGTLALSPDGRLMAMAYGTQQHMSKTFGKAKGGRFDNEVQRSRISIWDTATGKIIMELPEEWATAVAFSPDGKKLAAGSSGGEVKFFDLAPEDWPHADKTPVLTGKELDTLWAELGGDAVEPAYAAVWTLSAAGTPIVQFLKEKLQPQKASAEQLKDLLTKLDSDKYAVREGAFRDLKKLGSAIEPELRLAAADDKTSAEVRKRLEDLLDSMRQQFMSPEEIRLGRALQVLERIGGAEARAVLTRLAEGTPGVWLTEEARRAAKRLEGR